jgi:type VI secretion system secreted protein VgrG
MSWEQNQEIWIEEPTKDLLLVAIEGEEAISEPYRYRLTLASAKKSIPAADLLRKPVTIWIAQHDGGKRPIHGRVRRFEQGMRQDEFTEYRMEVVPWLWLMSLSSDCRFYLEKNVVDITKAVFEELGFSDFRLACTRQYPAREYCVQYNETHLDFLSRLWEEEGIFYFHEHSGSKHTLVLADDPSAVRAGEFTKKLQNAAGDGAYSEMEIAEELAVSHAVHTGGLTIIDHDFERTSGPLSFTATSDGVGKHLEYPGPHVKPTFNDRIARARIEHEEAMQVVVTGHTNARGLVAGTRVDVVDAPSGAESLQVLRSALTARHAGFRGEGDEVEYHNTFTCIPASSPYRPPRRTPKPRIHGAQTAMVATESDEEIHVDKYGRVQVLFHWDRQKANSCWVRVSSTWAGPGMGFIQLPRANDEVIVDFLDGDPDRPIITGRVYNAGAMPPYALPGNKTQSGLKTRSSEKGESANFNELRFEDKKGSEEIFAQAEKDLTVLVKNEEKRTVKEGNQTILLEKGDQLVTLDEGNQTVTVKKGDRKVVVEKGSEVVTVHTNRTTTIETGNDELKVQQGNLTIALQQGNVTIKAAVGKITLDAMQGIDLKVGQSTVKLSQQGVDIGGMMVKMAGQAKTDIGGPMTSVKADAILQLQGALTKIN